MKRVVKFVSPLGIDTVTSGLPAGDDSRVIQIAFGDQYKMLTYLRRESLDLSGQVFQEMKRRGIDERVYSVKPQAIKMIIAQPHQGVVDKESSNLMAPVAIEIYCGAPRRLVLLCVVRSEITEVIPNGAEMVINHVKQHRQPLLVARIY